MKKILFIAAAFFMLLGMYSCKPTEKNYQQAYEIARQKKEKDAVDVDAEILNAGMLKEEKADSVSDEALQVETIKVTPCAESETYYLIVAKYRMSTNAKAHAASLEEQGYDSEALSSGPEDWYVSIGKFSDETAACEFWKTKSAGKKTPALIGLTEPFILRSR